MLIALIIFIAISIAFFAIILYLTNYVETLRDMRREYSKVNSDLCDKLRDAIDKNNKLKKSNSDKLDRILNNPYIELIESIRTCQRNYSISKKARIMYIKEVVNLAYQNDIDLSKIKLNKNSISENLRTIRNYNDAVYTAKSMDRDEAIDIKSVISSYLSLIFYPKM